MISPPIEKSLFTVGKITVSVNYFEASSNFQLSGGTEKEMELVAIYLLEEGFINQNSEIQF